MADNLKTTEADIDQKIVNTNGPSSILAADQNAIFKDIARKAGKYVGLSYKARENPAAGVVPSGTLFWNGNALTATANFTLTISALTADLNNVTRLMASLSKGSLIHFKDYSGRSAFLKVDSWVAAQDSGGADIFNITVAGFADNTTYNYVAADDEICIIEFIIAPQSYIPFGTLTIRQSEANATANTTKLTAGDIVSGLLNNDIKLNYGVYLTGDPDPMDINSYDPNTVDFIDPNEV